MEFLTASIKEKQKQKREELRQFLLMKDRAIINLGLDEHETAALLEKQQRVEYLGVLPNTALQNWNSSRSHTRRKKQEAEQDKLGSTKIQK